MWDTNLSGARKVFEQMKSDGFNAVGLIIPWGEFQPGLTPPSYNAAAFSRLDQLISVAGRLHLRVILRLSYEIDVDPYDQLASTRFEEVFSRGSIYAAWLDYISRIHSSVQQFSNVAGEYITWEDFSEPMSFAEQATTQAQRIQLASEIGFTSWLRSNYSLSKVGSMYGTAFSNWAQVPTPPRSSPLFSLIFRYNDWALIHRFFKPAKRIFPALTIETRVDVDPLYSGSTVVGSYSHSDTFDLPGTKVTGMYFSPYMNDPSSNLNETWNQAVSALETTLKTMSARARGQKLFIYEFEITSNSPAVANDPEPPPNQLPQFVTNSAAPLREYTTGYALWTYRDFNLSPIYNPSFTLGTSGWTVQNGRPSQRDGQWALSMRRGGSATQTFHPGDFDSGGSATQATFSISATPRTPGPAQLTVRISGAPAQVLTIDHGSHNYLLQFPLTDIASGAVVDQLSLTASAPVAVTDVQVYAFTQVGDVYSTAGSPGVAVAPLRTLNRELSQPASPTP